MRVRRTRRAQPDDAPSPPGSEPHDLAGLFAAPSWLRDLGRSAWLAIGITLFVVGAVWILALTQAIVAPVITAAVVAAVASPLVRWLEGRGVARGLGAAVLLVSLIVLGAAVAGVVVGGIAALSSGFVERVEQNPAVPAPVRERVAEIAQKGIPVVPVGDVERAALDQGLPPDAAEAVADDYGDAQLQGLKRAIGAVGIFAVLSLWFTRRLPGRAKGPNPCRSARPGHRFPLWTSRPRWRARLAGTQSDARSSS